MSDAGKLRLPRLIGDGMVLQRGVDLKIWGWASPGSDVTAEFPGGRYTARADGSGRWETRIGPLVAGGPFDMAVSSGGETLTVRDILVGEVWLCSGQSNMELPMSRVKYLYPEEASSANNLSIRQFLVPKEYDFSGPREDYRTGMWESVTPENIPRFYAASYFFAKTLYERYGVPIGLINCASGGTPVEAWMSKEALRAFPDSFSELARCEDAAYVEAAIRADAERADEWYRGLDEDDEGLRGGWHGENADDGQWSRIRLTEGWINREELAQNGAFWFRRTFDVPAEFAGKPANLRLGCVRDADFTYINGVLVGSIAYQYPPRDYDIPAGLLRAGRNTIAVRVLSLRNIGGFVADKPYRLTVRGFEINLDGEWACRVGAARAPLAPPVTFDYKPAGLWNAMICPSLNYAVKGVIWYQGESNTSHPEGYAERFSAMVADWRVRRVAGNFPFLFVQLANYVTPHAERGKSGWPRLREEQRKCLAVENSAMAVAIDIGEYNDLHPVNKGEVGRRLALAALARAYGEDIEYSGPVLERAYISGGDVRIAFSRAAGLEARGGGLRVEVSGADGQFVSMPGAIEGREVVVKGAGGESPAAVRYAWEDSPSGGLLYNGAGLPASPFEVNVESGC